MMKRNRNLSHKFSNSNITKNELSLICSVYRNTGLSSVRVGTVAPSAIRGEMPTVEKDECVYEIVLTSRG